MGMFSIILIVGALVGALVLLILLYAMCRSCNSQKQRDQDIEARVHILFQDPYEQIQLRKYGQKCS